MATFWDTYGNFAYFLFQHLVTLPSPRLLLLQKTDLK